MAQLGADERGASVKKLLLLTALLTALVSFGHGALSPRTARADALPFGTFSGTITPDALAAAGVPPAIADSVAGVWSITFSPDYTYSASFAGIVQSTGTFSADLATVTFTDTGGAQSCAAQGAPTGTYAYFWDGVTLEFTDPNDNCLGRLLVLLSTTYAPTG